ncbi:MAG: SIS domain-containing protein [Treponema sp.]|jgi:glucosamine--fructose-6-phosphate aminotransferase (isomerizing)|nr:SIS domain-containing protein [Treponema sp.]
MLRLEKIIRTMGEPGFWQNAFENARESCARTFTDDMIQDIKGVYISGCGTSCYAALYGKMLIEKYAALPCGVMEGNLGETFAWDLIGKNTLFIGVSNTGGSASVCRTLEKAAAAGAKTFAITGVRESPLAKICGGLLYFPGTEDDVPTKTRSYVETLIMLLALALRLGKKPVQDNFRAHFSEAAQAAEKLIGEKEGMQRLADSIGDAFSLTVVGTGLHLANVYEASLKLCEMGWMNTSAFEIENYLHGRFRGSSPACPYVVFAPAGPGYPQALDFLGIAHKKGGRVIFITDRVTPPVRELSHAVIEIPRLSAEEILPLVDIIPVYQLGLYLGINHGYEDPAPRHDGLTAQSTRLGDLYPQYGTITP